MQPAEGLKLIECEADVVFTTGGLSDPKSGIVPDAGLLEFNTEGGVPYPNGPVTDVVGGAVGIDVGVTGLGGGSVGLDCVGGVGGGDFGVAVVDDDEDRKMHEPEPIHRSEELIEVIWK
ncbi:hypothetical protein V8G54_029790 [Vigna mungo]|uniref:Uncharacterized protein n=1 Tax=Vigna mungo TaxID=3915 RepID=A0AAQ3MVG4_VIGMU